VEAHEHTDEMKLEMQNEFHAEEVKIEESHQGYEKKQLHARTPTLCITASEGYMANTSPRLCCAT
jgi:hypothetical protein